LTSRERLLAVINGETPDQTPVIVFPEDEFYSDAGIISIKRLANSKVSSRIVLVEVLSPLGRAIRDGIDLNAILHEDPTKGEEVIRSYVSQAMTEISVARDSQADGIFYHLQGAEPKFSTPMQYGGHYLEADREIMTSAQDARFNLIFVDGGPEVYIDFVSDLPAHVFAWHKPSTGIEVSAVRKMRKGILATTDPEADILFGRNYGLLHELVKHNTMVESNA
jgi:hypothetical protein